jgi:hypothetical protein
MACRFSELVVDSRDPEALAAFWAAVLDYRTLGREEGAVEIGPGAGFGGAAPTLVFAPVPDPTPGKVRLHIDLNATDRGDEGWHVLADPEGNQFCLLERRLPQL